MSDKIKRVTPREIAEMLINEQAYQSTLFVLAEEHDAEIERLKTALKSVLDACDAGRMVERGAGGMTVEAQMRRSVYVNVPALPIEEARAALEAQS
jgi:hypothetical protein